MNAISSRLAAIALLFGLLVGGAFAVPALAQTATTAPLATTAPAATATTAPQPTAVPTEAPTVAPTEAPTEVPAAEASPIIAVTMTTLVMWYQVDPSGDFLQLGPLDTTAQLVAGPGDPAGRPTGKADFDSADNNEMPRIEIGDSIFDAYPIAEDDPETIFRWLYFDYEDGKRPATLVMQIEAKEGPYKGQTGTATFISRAADDQSSGVLVIMVKDISLNR